jgi:hypothetical protein
VRQKKIAFVFHPLHHGVRLDTMPFALNVLRKLERDGREVDLFLWEEPDKERLATVSKTTRAKYFRLLSGLRGASLYSPAQLYAEFAWRGNYAAVFAVGQIGAFVGDIVARASSCPLILANDEFPSMWGETVWAKLERRAARRAAAFIMPSAGRFEQLCKELAIEPSAECFVFPNIAKVERPAEDWIWAEILGLPAGKKVILQAGTVKDAFQAPEILCSLPLWPEEAVLLVHSVSAAGARYRQQLSHLELPGKAFWTDKPLPEAEFNSLTAFCDASFALYRDTGLNTSLMGTSSGKMLRSIACGRPVITSHFPSLAFVEEEGVGVQVNHPSEIPAAIRLLVDNADAFRERCLAFAEKLYRAEDAAWSGLLEMLERRGSGERSPRREPEIPAQP